MDRRGFLRMLGLGAAAAVAPTKAYSFLGNILRPRPTWTINRHTREMLERQINPPRVALYDVMDLNELVAEMGGRLGIDPVKLALSRPFTSALKQRSLFT